MAYTAGNLTRLVPGPVGRAMYRYDTTDQADVVEDAGYFNNSDDDLNLQKGDTIKVVVWTAVDTGTISEVKDFIVTNVIANDAAASAGNVNIAEIGGTGTVSSDG